MRLLAQKARVSGKEKVINLIEEAAGDIHHESSGGHILEEVKEESNVIDACDNELTTEPNSAINAITSHENSLEHSNDESQ